MHFTDLVYEHMWNSRRKYRSTIAAMGMDEQGKRTEILVIT